MQLKQYTIRNLEPKLDEVLRAKTKVTGHSLNEVVLEALRKGAGLGEKPIFYHDLDHLAGTLKDDPQFEETLQLQDAIDTDLWS